LLGGRGLNLTLLGHIAHAFRDWRVSLPSGSSEKRPAQQARLTTSFSTQIYLGGVIYFGANAALASISAFLPTIIKTFGYSEFSVGGCRCHCPLLCILAAKMGHVYAANAVAQLLTVPPYAVTSIVITISSWLSDRLLTRGLFIIISSAVGGAGYL